MAGKGINFVVAVDNKKADEAIKQLQQSFKRMESQLRGISGNIDGTMDKSAQSVNKLGKAVKSTTTKITADMKSIAKSMLGFQAFTQAQAYLVGFIGEVGRFNKAMKEVSTISSQVAGDIEGYSQKVREMISQIPVGAEESAKALYQIESASHHGADALNILQQSAKAAIGGVTDTATAADAITTILNAYHMDASKAQAVSDKLFMTVRNGKTTWNELAHSIANVAPAAASYGVSLDEMLAAIATMTKQGVQTANAVTQLNAVITAGTSALGDGAFRSRSFADAIAMIEHAANGSDLALKAELGNVRAMRAVFTLGGDSAKLFSSDLNDISNSAGAASSAYDKMSSTLGAQQKLLKNNLTNLISDFVGSANSSLKNVVMYINKAFDSGEAQKFLRAMKELVVIYGAYKATIITTTAVQKLHNRIMEETRVVLSLNKLEMRRTDIVVKAVTASEAKQIAVTQMLKRSWQSFTATLLSNPVMWVVAAITALVYATYKVVTADNAAEVAQKSLNRQIDSYNKKVDEANNKTNEFISTIRDQNKTLYQQEKAYKDLIKQRGIFAKYSIDDLKKMSQDEIDKLLNQSSQDEELRLREKQIQALQDMITLSQRNPIDNAINNMLYVDDIDKQYGLTGTAFSVADIYHNDISTWNGMFNEGYQAQWQAILAQNLAYLTQMKQQIADANVTEALVPQANELKGYYDTAKKAVDVYLDAVNKIPEAERDGSKEVAKLANTASDSMNTIRNTILRKKAELQATLAKNPTDIMVKTQIDNLDKVMADINNLATLIKNGGQPWAFDVLVNFRKGQTQFDPTQFNGLDFKNKGIGQSAFTNTNNGTMFGAGGLDFGFMPQVDTAAGTGTTNTPTAEETYKQQIEAEKRRQKEEQRRQREEAKRERENRKKFRDEQRKEEREYKKPREDWDASQSLQEAENALLPEGKAKASEKALNDYNNTLEKINREYQDIRKQRYSNALAEWQEDNPDWAKNGMQFGKTIDDFPLTDIEQEAWDKRNEVARQAYEKQLKEIEVADMQYMLDYLKQYGTMQEQRLATTEEYNEKIAKSNNEWEKKSLTQERDKTIAQSNAKALAMDIDWSATFEGVGNVLGDIAKETLVKVEEYMKTDEFKNLSAENKKTYTDLQKKLKDETGGNSTSPFNFKIWDTIAENVRAYQESVSLLSEKTEAHTQAVSEIEQAQEELKKATTATARELAQTKVNTAKDKVDATAKEQTDAQQKKDDAQQILTDNTNKASQGMQNFSNYLNEMSNGSLFGFANGISKLITSLGKGSDGVGKSLGELAGKIGGLIGAILQIIDALGDDPKGFIDGILNKVATVIESILSQLPEIVLSIIKDAGKIIKGALSGVAGMFGVKDIFSVGGNASRVNKEENRLNKALDRVTTALDKLREQLDDSKGGWETISAGEEALKAAQDKQELLSKKLENRMGYTKSHHSNTYYLRDTMNTEDYDKISNVVGRDVRSVDDIYDMSPEEMAKVRANAATVWDKLVTTGKYDWEEYWDAVADAGTDITDIQNEIKEKLTSTTFDSVYDGFRDMLQNMDSSLQDFSDDASEMIYKALMNNFVADEYKDKLKTWYDKMADYLKDQNGDLTKKQISELTDEYTTMAKNAQSQRDMIAKITGYTGESSQQGTSKGFSGMNQDTAEELNGRFSALQVSGEQIATMTRNSVEHLINIGANINIGVTILDDIRSLQAVANSYLSDIVNYTKPLRLFEEKIDRLITNTNNL